MDTNGWDWQLPPEVDRAWRTISWWHANRPQYRQVLVLIQGGPCMAFTPADRTWVPEHVKDARTVLGFPRTPRTGEGP
jgi:hypothetical protein